QEEVAVDVGPVAVPETTGPIAVRRALDLDDVGAEPGQHLGAGGGGPVVGEVDYADAGPRLAPRWVLPSVFRPASAGGRAAHQLRHLGQPHLGQVQVALRITPEPVGARVHRTAPREHLAVGRVHGDPRNLVGDVHRSARIDVDVHRLVDV